ncbi:hypothetical protein PIB30_052109 [Stylosanthes scabra]|uniref:Putative plant transposon protein domain-containing protein n=1 Tax=Stylosanthes scabra TaxID=79078 RepID=A0ABU6THV2_9FABA|nr:hypothetical protein [Stylosanthes scabra]
MVRGTEISFAPSNIQRVLKLKKDPLPDAPSYHERKANKDFRLDHILEDMCEEGAEWVRHRDGRPHYLRRSNLEPMLKGWYEFVCRSILPTTNRSDLTVERAMLIHSIIIGENINVEEIIAEQIYKFVYKADISSSLPFPSIIAALCADAKIPAIPDDTLIPQEPPIFKEMEMQGIPVTMANLVIHRKREEEFNQERMRYERILQEAAAQQAREANKGKSREVVPDSEDESSFYYELLNYSIVKGEELCSPNNEANELVVIAWSFNPHGIDTPLHCGILLDMIRYTCRDLGFAKTPHHPHVIRVAPTYNVGLLSKLLV